ncbi:MAG: cell wall hydrolase [Limnochordaceae bacterium]|nr:cell wall hydrolase [Limnochordaceae bacterium]
MAQSAPGRPPGDTGRLLRASAWILLVIVVVAQAGALLSVALTGASSARMETDASQVAARDPAGLERIAGHDVKAGPLVSDQRRPRDGQWRRSVTPWELELMARLVYGEARGEPYVGKVAVAAVVLNRLDDPRFPHTVEQVVFEPWAFTAVYDGQINLRPDQASYRAVLDALAGWDPTGGAVYYYNPARTSSPWVWNRPVVRRIGRHVFAR